MIRKIIYRKLFRLAEFIYPVKRRMRDKFREALKNRQLTIKDCKCRFNGRHLIRCKFHKECIGTPCALALNTCNNPKHKEAI